MKQKTKQELMAELEITDDEFESIRKLLNRTFTADNIPAYVQVGKDNDITKAEVFKLVSDIHGAVDEVVLEDAVED